MPWHTSKNILWSKDLFVQMLLKKHEFVVLISLWSYTCHDVISGEWLLFLMQLRFMFNWFRTVQIRRHLPLQFNLISLLFLQKIKEPFLEAVKITLGDRYTDYMANVYTKTIDFILSALSHGYLDKNQCYELQSTKSPVTSALQTSHPGEKTESDQANGIPSDQSVPKIEISAQSE